MSTRRASVGRIFRTSGNLIWCVGCATVVSVVLVLALGACRSPSLGRLAPCWVCHDRCERRMFRWATFLIWLPYIFLGEGGNMLRICL